MQKKVCPEKTFLLHPTYLFVRRRSTIYEIRYLILKASDDKTKMSGVIDNGCALFKSYLKLYLC